MDQNLALDISREALFVLLKTAAPLMLVGLVVGLLISLFQALTQIQEQTLSFVPKIIAMFFALIFFLPFIGRELGDLSQMLSVYITDIGSSRI